MLSPNDKGGIAELKIATAAAELGVPVLRPMTEHSRYDLGFEIGDRILRVQCKWGNLLRESVIQVKVQSSRCTPAGYVRKSYGADEIDLLAVYCGALDRCYLLPRELAVERKEVWLRVTPPLNCQRACINLAADFEFAGAVAQLEERDAGSVEARGSSPLSSTPSQTEVGCHQFRNHFGFYLERAAAGDEILIRRRERPYARLVPVRPPLAAVA